jgi:hypothetical protein
MNKKDLLNKIKTSTKLKLIPIHVEDWDDTVYLQSMTVNESLEFGTLGTVRDERKLIDFILGKLYTKDGQKLCENDEDKAVFMEVDSDTILGLSKKVFKIYLMSDEAVDDAKKN